MTATTKLAVAEAIAGCLEARQAELKRGSNAGRWLSPLNIHVIPELGRYPIEEIDQHVLKDTLGPIWHDKPEAAAKALNRMNLTLKHAAALDLNVDLRGGRPDPGKISEETGRIAGARACHRAEGGITVR